jgi:hypothetical protein
MQARPEGRITRKARIIRGLDETSDEALPKIIICALAGMDIEHLRVTAARLRVCGRASEDFSPIAGQPLDVIGVARMRERVTEDGILQTALVVRGREREKCSLASSELIDGTPWHSYAEPCSAWASSAERRVISSSETSSKCVAKYHLLPNGS